MASTRDVFARYLGDGCPACVDKPRLDCGQAIALIQRAGGVAALAHPPHDLRQSQLQALVDQGMRAIEVDGPGFSTGKSQRIRDLGRPIWTGRYRRQRFPRRRPRLAAGSAPSPRRKTTWNDSARRRNHCKSPTDDLGNAVE